MNADQRHESSRVEQINAEWETWILDEREVAKAPRRGDCFFCRRFATRLEYDHFPIPYSLGGRQVVPACLTCHDLKDRTFILDWPADRLREAFEGMTPMTALFCSSLLNALARDESLRQRPQRSHAQEVA